MSVNIADKLQIEQNLHGDDEVNWKSFTNDKNIIYVNDQQNGAYSNQVSWDLSSVISQNGWLSMQEGYILMPFCTSLVCGTALTNATVPANFLSIKDNFVNFVDSIQFFVNGEQLIDQTTFSNIPIQILDKMTMSVDDLNLKGAGLNIYPDKATSIRFSAAATSSGDGYFNNIFYPNPAVTTVSGYDYSRINDSINQRMLNTSTTPVAKANTVAGYPPALSTDVNNFTQTLQPYYSNNGNAVTQGNWNYIVYLPLKRLSDLFSKYPLIKGSQMRLVLNFNSSSVPVSFTASGSTMALTANPTMLAGNTVTPLISNALCSGITNGGTSALTIATKIQTTTVAPVANTTAQKGFASLPQCRIYLPAYKINPNYEEKLLSNRVKTIRYWDLYQQSITNVSNGATFSQVLSTALPNVQCLIMVPFANTTSGVFATATCPQYQSPFDTAPATSLPGGMLGFQNFNVSVSGVNMFNQNLNYNVDNWVNEVQKLSLNGGLSRELSSGLVNLTQWSWSPFVIADLSRRPESADKTYQSVTVSGTNNTGISVDYYCFIYFQKEIEIDCISGVVKKLF